MTKSLSDAVLPYVRRILITLSVLLNTVLGGYSNQTFSARNWSWKRKGNFHLVYPIDLVLGKGHCMDTWVTWQLLKDTLKKIGK